MTTNPTPQEREVALLSDVSAHRARQRQRMQAGEHHSDGSALSRANRDLLKTADPRTTAPGNNIEQRPLVGDYLSAFKTA